MMCAEQDPQSSQQHSPEHSSSPQKGRRRRWLIPTIAAAAVVVLLLIVVALVPTMLSTDAGSRYIANQVSEDLQGDVRIGSLSLSWFGSQAAGDVVVIDEQGRETLTVDHAETGLSLFSAIRGDYNLGETRLSGVRADIVVDETGETNLARALRSEEPPVEPDEPAGVPPSLRFDLLLSDARVTVHAPDMEPVVFEGIEAEAALASINDPLEIRNFVGRSQHAGVTGSFSAQATLHQLFAEDGTLTLSRATGTGSAEANDLPVPGIDRLLGMNGLLASAIGDLANLRLNVESQDNQPQFMLAANAPRFNAEIHGVLQENGAAINQPADVDMQLEPEFARRLLGLELQETVPIQLQITEFRTPIEGFDPSRTAVTATVRLLEPARFLDEQGEPFTLSNLQAGVQSENVAQAVALQLDADLDVAGEQGAINIDGQVADLYDDAGQLQLNQAQADLTADVANVPTVFIDRVLQQDGLLVEALGDRVSMQASTSSVGADQIEARLNVTSPRFTTTDPLNLRADAEQVTLVDPARIEMIVAPRVASQIVGAVTLAEPEPAIATLHTFRAPRPAAGEPLFDPENTQIDLELVGQQAIELLDVPQIDQAIAENFELRLNGPSLNDLQLTLAALLQDTEGTTRISDLAGSPLDAMLQVNTGLTQEFDRLPMQTLLTLSSDRLNGRLVGTIAPGFSGIRVTEQSTLNMRLTRQTLAALDLAEQIDASMLDEPLQVAVTIDQLDTPLPVDLAQLQLDAVADVLAEAPQQRADAFAVWLGGEQASVNIQASPTDADEPQTRLQLAVNAQRLNGNLAADLARDEEQGTTTIALAQPAEFQAVLSRQALQMLNAVQADGEPMLLEEVPLTARVTTLQGQVQPLAWPTLTAEAELAADRIALAAGVLGEQFAHQLNNQQAADGQQQPGIIIRDARSQLAFNGGEESARFQLTGETEIVGEPTEPGRLNIDAVAQQILTDEGELALAAANVEADIDVNQLPTRMLAGFVGWERQLVPLLGPLTSLQAAAQWDGLPPRDGQVDAQLQTANFSPQLALRITDGILELAQPSTSTLNLTPEAYDALVTPAPGEADEEAAGEPAAAAPAEPTLPPRTLAEPAQIQLNLQSLRFPLPGGGEEAVGEVDGEAEPPAAAIDPSQLTLVAGIASEGLTFVSRDGRQQPATLAFDFTFNGENLAQPAPYSLTGSIRPATPRVAEEDQQPAQQEQADEPPADVAAIPSEEGTFRFEGSIAEMFDSQGQPNFGAMLVELQGEASDLPVALLDDLTRQEGMLLASIGPAMDMNLSAELRQFTGPVSLNATATHANAEIIGNLDAGTFTPTQAITANLAVTEALGSRLLRQIHPLLETAVGGEEPIALNVPADGVSIPIRPFSLADAQIPVANVALGRLAMEQGGTLAAVLGGLEGLIGQNLEAGQTIEAWFTPAVVQFTDGRLRYERRLDVLFDQRLPMASWGEIDLREETFNLTLALPASLLERAFGIRMPTDGMFTIPMRGQLGGAPQINWGQAGTDIARLTAQAELAERSPVPGLLDEVLGRVIDTNVPQPSVTPLPWAQTQLEPLTGEPPTDPQQQPAEQPQQEEEEQRPRTPTLRDLLEGLR